MENTKQMKIKTAQGKEKVKKWKEKKECNK